MRLLILSPEFPFPLTNGTRHKVYHLLRYLASRHEVTLLAFHQPGNPPQPDHMAGVLDTGCRDAFVYAWRSDSILWDAPASALEPVPHAFRKFRVAEFQKHLRRTVQERSFDVVHCDINMTEMYKYLTGREARVISPSDSFTKMMLRMVRFAPGMPRKVYCLTQAMKFWHVERHLYSMFTKCHVVTQPEAMFLKRINPYIDLSIIPMGADVPDELPTEESRKPNPDIVITGQINSPFTEDSVLWFYRHVWPTISKEVPGCRLWLVGRDPTRRVCELAERDATVQVTGYVENMTSAIRDKLVYVCPLIYGVGIRTRLFEVMASGIPIVTTSVGCEGIDMIDGQHALVRDTPIDIARGILQLIHSPALRSMLATGAYALVKSRYTWKLYAEGMESLYGEAIEKHRMLGHAVI
jgi:glycosyltransferase involved in cell wall biosynthesis